MNSHLIEAFNNEPCKKVQTQILSLIPFKDFNKETIISVMPKVTERHINNAIGHVKSIGAGALLEKKEIFREKINQNKLDHFLEFLIGEDFLHDVSYGTRVLKTAVGDIVIPNVIRQTSNSRLINFYFEECNQQNMKSLSRTTCFKILNKCSASFKKSMKGLDSMKVDGLNGFDKLHEIVETLESLGLSRQKSLDLSGLIDSSCNYLKFKFRKKLKISCACSDHCVTFALSELSEKNNSKTKKVQELGAECDHIHLRDCDDCLNIENMFKQIDEEIKRLIKDDRIKKQVVHHFQKSKESIFEWKHHIIRGFNQDLIKYKQLDEIKDEIAINNTNDDDDQSINSIQTKIKNKGIDFLISVLNKPRLSLKTTRVYY
jgi:hypothetical protein